MPLRLLLVDDDPEFLRLLERGLAADDVTIVKAGCADEAHTSLSSVPRGHFDLVVLDVNMPGASGLELLGSLRSQGSRLPVIFVTARGETSQMVAGLEAGADDWITKPFSLAELRARIDAVLRRQKSALLEYGDLRVDLDRQRAFRGEQALDLSPRELELLVALLRAKGDTVSREALLERIWELDFDPGTNVIDVQMSRLRRKLDRLGPACIASVRGVGYRVEAHPPKPGDAPR